MSERKPQAERISAVPPFGLRMLPDLRRRLEEAASAGGRSLNAEIVFRLEESFAEQSNIFLVKRKDGAEVEVPNDVALNILTGLLNLVGDDTPGIKIVTREIPAEGERSKKID